MVFKAPIKGISIAAEAFADALYRDGYCEKFIKKLVHKKHPDTTYRTIGQRIAQNKHNDTLTTERNAQKAYDRAHKGLAENRRLYKWDHETRVIPRIPLSYWGGYGASRMEDLGGDD